MFSVVKVSGPVFYQDWSGRRVEIRDGDTLSNEDTISSLSQQDIELKTLSNTILTLQTGAASSVQTLIKQASAALPSQEASIDTPNIQTIAKNEFKGTVIEDDGVGAYGELKSLDLKSRIPAQESSGKYGVLNISENGAWFYHLSEEAMDGELTSYLEEVDDAFDIQLESGNTQLNLEFRVFLQGTDDIPDILDSQISLPSSVQATRNIAPAFKQPLSKPNAEHEIMSMISDWLMTG